MTNTTKVVNSALFSVAAKVLGKSLGLISTVIIARILAPAEFGLIAMISMALYFFDILSHAAGEQYIVQKRAVSRLDRNTAWSLNLCLKLGIAALIVLASPLIAQFFERPELTTAFMCSALILPLQALKSPGLLLLRRQLRFSPLFWLSLLERLFALPVLIALALWLKSFWAFLLTDILVAAVGAILSYALVPMRPTLTLARVKQQWHFSQWMLGKSFLGYVRSQIDTLFVAKWFSPAALGQYHMSRDLAMMPAHYALSPAIEPLLAVFKNDRDNPAVLLNNVVFSLLVVCLIAFPIVAVLVVFSQPLILVLLGPGWQLAATLLPILSLLFLYWSLAQVVESAFVAQGKVRWLFGYDIFSLALTTAGLVIAVTHNMSLSALAGWRVATGSLATLILLMRLFHGNAQRLLPLLGLTLLVALITAVCFIPAKWVAAPLLTLTTLGVAEVALLALYGAAALAGYALLCLAMLRWLPSEHMKRLFGLMSIPYFRT